MTAMAMACRPDLIIFDEPTTALDVTTQIEVLAAFRRVVREHGVSAVYVSHDLAVVAQMADHILVLRQGRERESAATAQLLAAPGDDYTRSLLDAARVGERAPDAPVPTTGTPLLEVSSLTAGYGRVRDGVPEHPVLSAVDLTLFRGQAIGVIGENITVRRTAYLAVPEGVVAGYMHSQTAPQFAANSKKTPMPRGRFMRPMNRPTRRACRPPAWPGRWSSSRCCWSLPMVSGGSCRSNPAPN